MSMESMQSGLPPQVALYHLATGHYFSHALGLAAKLGIAELLKDGPRHAKDLAEATGTHAPSLDRVMRLLASTGVFEEQEDGAFALTSLGQCLRAGVPGGARDGPALRWRGGANRLERARILCANRESGVSPAGT